MNSINKKFNREIEDNFEIMEGMDPTTEEYSNVVNSQVKLIEGKNKNRQFLENSIVPAAGTILGMGFYSILTEHRIPDRIMFALRNVRTILTFKKH